MLIGHGNPIHTIDNWTFPFIGNDIQGVMTIGARRLEQVMDFFIHNLNESYLDGEGKVRVRVSCSAGILSVAFILQNVEEVISQERDKTRVRFITLHAMRLARASGTEHKN